LIGSNMADVTHESDYIDDSFADGESSSEPDSDFESLLYIANDCFEKMVWMSPKKGSYHSL